MKTFAEAKKELERRYTDEKMSENYLEAIEAYGFAKALGYIYGEDETMLPFYSKILEKIIPNVVARMAAATSKNIQSANEPKQERLWICDNDIVAYEKGDEDMIEYCKDWQCSECKYSKRCDDFVFAPRAYKDSGRKFLWVDDKVHFEANEDDIKIFKACKTTKICRNCAYANRCPCDMDQFEVCPESYALLTEAEFDKKRHEYCVDHVCTDCPYKYYCESR